MTLPKSPKPTKTGTITQVLGAKPIKGKDPIPMIYRVHDSPDPGKMDVFAVFIEKFGHKIDLQ